MNNSTIKEIVPILKRSHLVEASKQYSDYVVDIVGKSFEDFVQNNYMSDKSVENVIIKSELSDDVETLEDIIGRYFSDYVDIDLDMKTDRVKEAVMNEETFDAAVSTIAGAIERYIKDNC